MTFPPDYPFSPPQFRFIPSIFHPNVYKDGRLCISILHKSGDVTSGEPDGETWSPAQTVESVLVSIVSLLSDPNTNSPANVDASVTYSRNPEEFRKRVREEVERSRLNIPPGFKMPNEKSAYVAPKANESADDVVDEDFWYESEDSADLDNDGDASIASDDNDYDDEDDFEDDESVADEEESGSEDTIKSK